MDMTTTDTLGRQHKGSVKGVVSTWCFCRVFPEFASLLQGFAQCLSGERTCAESVCAVSLENAHMAMGLHKQIHVTDICTMFL